ncbi:peptidyl-prolyl cis-trans isomerase FKBP17-1, chloroplastic-like isoform X2 [Hibiscus syriacus]|uniref:peptidyl-prolyl cis-trans isomerase FKBP17-1, chloroplastic-like isoform X2 n=1 Tax=Hibiscus syriacus TaxID=106335 RepID=UPI0019248D9F|nr:peptidyl-prolyl cis-trans isomerase FKBP17-1, chloroplastic-like isoform X2 [Hibiscus syriacus]
METRLAAKQGWRFDSTYDHKDSTGEPIPFIFTLGSGKVISGIESAVRSMKVGGTRRVIIPPSQGYQNTSQEPIPPDFFDRQRLFTTIFNPTRLSNGEGSTLGTLIFDIELISIRH